jgi:hypothetical protein
VLAAAALSSVAAQDAGASGASGGVRMTAAGSTAGSTAVKAPSLFQRAASCLPTWVLSKWARVRGESAPAPRLAARSLLAAAAAGAQRKPSARVDIDGPADTLAVRLRGLLSANSGLDSLEDALATAQHHDGVSGTSKQHVACDYARRLAAGRAAAHAAVSPALSSLAFGTNPPAAPEKDAASASASASSDAASTLGSAQAVPLSFAECPLLNVSVCKHTEHVRPGESVSVLLWNALGWPRVEPVRLPVVAHDIHVTDSSGNDVLSQVRGGATASLHRN